MGDAVAMTFDPYSDWLGLPPGPRPPDPYALLGLARFERDPARIAAAADGCVREIRRRAPFDRVEETRQLLQEVLTARNLLTTPAGRRRFEMGLRSKDKRRSPAVAAPVNGGDAKPTVPPKDPSPGRPANVMSARRTLPRVAGFGGAVLVAAVCLNLAWEAWRRGDAASDRPMVVDSVVAAGEAGTPVARAADPQKDPLGAASSEGTGGQATSGTGPVIAAEPAGTELAEVDVARVVPDAVAVRAPVEAARPEVVDAVAAYRLPRSLTGADRDAFAGHVRDMLYEGFARKGGDLAAAARHHQAATALTSESELADYALALVLWNRLRFDEVEVRLRAARGTEANPFPPARRALVRLNLDLDRRAAALEEAVALAGALADMEDKSGARDASLRWLGRLTAALESPWSPDAELPKDVIEADAAIREALGGDLSRVYETGRRSLRDDYAAREEEVTAAIAELAATHRDSQAQELEEIAGERDAAQDKQEKVSRSAAEWKTWLDEQVGAIDPELEKLVPAFQQLAFQAEAAWASYLTISEEITRQQSVDLDETPPRFGSRVGADLFFAREQALAQFKFVSNQAVQVRRQAELLLAKRRAATAQYERATKTLTGESDAIRKWEGILKRRAAETGAADAENSPAVRSLRRRLRDVDTYVPFDLEVEKDAVLKAVGEEI